MIWAVTLSTVGNWLLGLCLWVCVAWCVCLVDFGQVCCAVGNFVVVLLRSLFVILLYFGGLVGCACDGWILFVCYCF